MTSKICIYGAYLLVFVTFSIATFWVMWSQSQAEKLRIDFVKSDCTGEAWYDIVKADEDYLLPIKDQQGLMHCYCKQMTKLYGDTGLQMLFPGGRKYCVDWYPTVENEWNTTLLIAIYIAVTNLVLQQLLNCKYILFRVSYYLKCYRYGCDQQTKEHRPRPHRPDVPNLCRSIHQHSYHCHDSLHQLLVY